MVTRAYCRCNSGHYFMGEYCPFDGWSSEASRELTRAVKKLAGRKQQLTLELLREAGLSAAALARCVVVEFGSPASAFEALSPEYYVVDGEAQPLVKMSPGFK